MKNIFTLIKKELTRFFKDKRLFVSTVILPGLMIFVVYSIMGGAMSSMFVSEDDYVYNIYISGESSTIPLDSNEYFTVEKSGFDIESVKESIANNEGKVDLLVIIPDGFDEAIQNGSEIPNIEVFYNSIDTNSYNAYALIGSIFNAYEQSVSNLFDIDKFGEGDLASENDVTGMMFSLMVPMLMMMFLFTGCVAVTPESIAGEKERGTFTTLLATPIKRSHIAISKIVALSLIALLCGCSSFLGTILSLPKLMGGIDGGMLTISAYGFSDYMSLFGVIISTVLIIVSIMSVISAYAKNVKEATSLSMPLMIVCMVIGILSMFGTGAALSPLLFLIPLYNSVLCMSGIFAFSITGLQIGITIATNIVCMLIFTFVLAKMFNSEKIMFGK